MKKLLLIAMMFLVLTNYAQLNRNIEFGTDTTFEIATWNIEHFPKNEETTINYVAQIIQMMQVDIIGMQEIEDQDAFYQVVDQLEGWEGYWTDYSYTGMAYVYNTNVVEVTDEYKILTEYDRELPRAPMVVEIDVNDLSYIIINNHYKCCGDGTLDDTDEWDEETRRYDANVLLKDYIETHFSGQKVLLIGDLNDELTDEETNNVFQPFFTDASEYLFVDMHIAESSAVNWSYPSYPSHLDHILVTNEIFTNFNEDIPRAQTVKPDDVISGGWSTYEENVSDHRPVALKISMPGNNNGNKDRSMNMFKIFPNPVNERAKILFQNNTKPGKFTILTTEGQKVKEKQIIARQEAHLFDVSSMRSGLYFAKMVSNGQTYCKKFIVSKP